MVKIRNRELNINSDIKIPVDLLIDQVKEEFGYYLPYLLLKRSKKIKKVRFERLLGKNYRIQETLTIKSTDYL